MTYEDYWEREPRLVKAYREAERIKIENQNTFEWLQGKYFFDALCVALSNFSAGLGGKQGKQNYPDKPHRITPMTEEEIEEDKKRKLEAYKAYLTAWQTAFNNKHKEQSNGCK